MTAPEKNRPNTDAGLSDDPPDRRTDRRDTPAPRPAGGTGRTLREALEEARIHPDDFAEE